jgi:hypothetical protein
MAARSPRFDPSAMRACGMDVKSLAKDRDLRRFDLRDAF